MYSIQEKVLKGIYHLLNPILFRISMPMCTKFQYYILKRLGVNFNGCPRYISGKVWFDGGGYSKIFIGKRVTISSNVRILVHDWALDTIYEGIHGQRAQDPIGKFLEIRIGDYTFIGTGSIIMPGATIGKCCIIGAGSCVRGNIPDYSIVIGNPCKILEKSTINYLDKYQNIKFK